MGGLGARNGWGFIPLGGCLPPPGAKELSHNPSDLPGLSLPGLYGLLFIVELLRGAKRVLVYRSVFLIAGLSFLLVHTGRSVYHVAFSASLNT